MLADLGQCKSSLSGVFISTWLQLLRSDIEIALKSPSSHKLLQYLMRISPSYLLSRDLRLLSPSIQITSYHASALDLDDILPLFSQQYATPFLPPRSAHVDPRLWKTGRNSQHDSIDPLCSPLLSCTRDMRIEVENRRYHGRWWSRLGRCISARERKRLHSMTGDVGVGWLNFHQAHTYGDLAMRCSGERFGPLDLGLGDRNPWWWVSRKLMDGGFEERSGVVKSYCDLWGLEGVGIDRVRGLGRLCPVPC